MFLAKYYAGRTKLVDTPEWWMVKRHNTYYRHFKTFQEMRMWYYAIDEDVKVRRKRKPYALNSWTHDKVASCVTTKSWKKLNKCKKQWQKKKYYHESE